MNKPIKKTSRPKLTKEQRHSNAVIASREHRARMKAKGYRPLQVFVPNEIRDEVRILIGEMVTEHEAKADIASGQHRSTGKK